MTTKGGGEGGPDTSDLPHLSFFMEVDEFPMKAKVAATVPEVSPMYGNDRTGHWRLLVYPRSHRGDEQWCSAYLAAAVDYDPLCHGWWKKVDFSITAVHGKFPDSCVTRRGTNTFKGRGTTLAHNFEWGYNDLIKVDVLLKNGFLKKDRLRLKVELTVLDQGMGSPFNTLSKEELQEDLVWSVGVAAVPMVKACLDHDACPASVYDRKKMDTPLHKVCGTTSLRVEGLVPLTL